MQPLGRQEFSAFFITYQIVMRVVQIWANQSELRTETGTLGYFQGIVDFSQDLCSTRVIMPPGEFGFR